ncbi:MAG: sugar ABC transporter ATP-binding protein [Pseudomonadota bacterium]
MTGELVPSEPALKMKNVSKVFGGVVALNQVDFEVAAGEVHCLAGENGSGKSTLIKIATGVYQPDPGATITIGGAVVQRPTPGLVRRLGIAVIWQDLSLFPEMTVAENIAIETVLGARPSAISRRAMGRRAKEALETLGVSIDLGAPVRTLPIAKRQIVAIARALIADVRLIFMDEPTASLTKAETDHLLAIVSKLSAAGVAVVFVSHRLAEVLEVSKSVTVLRDGKIVGVYPTKNMTQSRLTELMTGEIFDTAVAARDVGEMAPVLEVKDLTRRGEYDDVTLTIRRGEILGLTGLIGAGRTELGLTLFGMTRPHGGTIKLQGKPVRFLSNSAAIAAGVAYVSEDRLSLGLIQPQSIADNIAITVLERLTTGGLIGGKAKRAVVSRWIDDLRVKVGKPTDAVATLSGGNQQRVVLSKWLATAPTLLILDCPTVGVDVGARAGIFAIVRRLAQEGLAILLMSDEAPEVYFNADRVLHMAGGRIAHEFDPRQIDLKTLEDAVYA